MLLSTQTTHLLHCNFSTFALCEDVYKKPTKINRDWQHFELFSHVCPSNHSATTPIPLLLAQRLPDDLDPLSVLRKQASRDRQLALYSQTGT